MEQKIRVNFELINPCEIRREDLQVAVRVRPIHHVDIRHAAGGERSRYIGCVFDIFQLGQHLHALRRGQDAHPHSIVLRELWDEQAARSIGKDSSKTIRLLIAEEVLEVAFLTEQVARVGRVHWHFGCSLENRGVIAAKPGAAHRVTEPLALLCIHGSQRLEEIWCRHFISLSRQCS